MTEFPDRTGSAALPEAAPDPFVGREAELSALGAELGHVRRGRSRTVVVEGPPGIGKSRLIRTFLASAAGNVLVVEVSGDENERHLDYGIVDQLRERVGKGSRRPADAPAGSHPLAAGAELLGLLADADAAASCPVALVVDDAHWADPASLQVLTFVLRRLHADRVLALVAVRQSVGSLPDGLLRVAAARGCRMTLPPLDEGEMARLARFYVDDLPDAAVQRLRRHTGGNPLHTRAVLEELDPEVLRRPDASLPAPRSFAAVVAARLAACDEETKRFVEAVAVLGPEPTLTLAARVASVTDARRALDQACAANLVEVVEGRVGHIVTFPHPLVRAAVSHELGPVGRAGLHARAGELLDGVAALEHRAAGTLVEDGVLAAELAANARREAGGGAPVRASVHLVEAARLSPDPADRESHLLDAVDLLIGAGEVSSAVGLAPDVRALADSARRDFVLGSLAFVEGKREEAEALLKAAWGRALPAGDRAIGARAAGQLAQIHALRFRPEEVVTWSRRSLEAGDPSSPYPLALTLLVSYLALSGCPDEAMVQLASAVDDRPVQSEVDAEGRVARGILRGWLGDFEGAFGDLAAAVESLDRRLTSAPGLMGLGALAQVEYRLGLWDQSVAHAGLAVSLATDAGQDWMLGWAHSHATWVLGARGAWTDAEAHVRAAHDAARAMGDESSWGCAAAARVHLASCRGGPSGVVEAAHDLVAAGRSDTEEPGVHGWRDLYAEALANLGRTEEADAALRPLEELAAARNRPVPLAAAARARGVLEAARGRAERARACFDAGLDHVGDLPVPFDRALVQEAYGRFLRRDGSRHQAATRLEEARQVFVELSAGPFIERVERELAACGLRPRRRCPDARTALTPQELAVAHLVATGRTNREVAAELFISPKTVEYHLANIFTKTGVRSRRELRNRLSAEVGPD